MLMKATCGKATWRVDWFVASLQSSGEIVGIGGFMHRKSDRSLRCSLNSNLSHSESCRRSPGDEHSTRYKVTLFNGRSYRWSA